MIFKPVAKIILKNMTRLNYLKFTDGLIGTKYIIIILTNNYITIILINECIRRTQWLMGRDSDSRLRGPGFESCVAMLIPWASVLLYIAPVHSAL